MSQNIIYSSSISGESQPLLEVDQGSQLSETSQKTNSVWESINNFFSSLFCCFSSPNIDDFDDVGIGSVEVWTQSSEVDSSQETTKLPVGNTKKYSIRDDQNNQVFENDNDGFGSPKVWTLGLEVGSNQETAKLPVGNTKKYSTRDDQNNQVFENDSDGIGSVEVWTQSSEVDSNSKGLGEYDSHTDDLSFLDELEQIADKVLDQNERSNQEIAKLLVRNTKEYSTREKLNDQAFENNIKTIFEALHRGPGLNKTQVNYLKTFKEGKRFSGIPDPMTPEDVSFLMAVLEKPNGSIVQDKLISVRGEKYQFVEGIELNEKEKVDRILHFDTRLTLLTENMTSIQVKTLRSSALMHS